jgi:cathepsin H
MMKLVCMLALVAVALAVPVANQEDDSYFWYEFGKFSSQHAREYNGLDAFHTAFANFKANLNMINAHNAGKSSYKLAVNKFADMTFEDFQKTHLGYKPSAAARHGEEYVPTNVAPAAAIDWRTKGAVGPVKDQGACGSCWAFSAIASLEGAHALSANKYTSLSEQQLVDCSGAFGNMGCNGGLMDQAFTYLLNATKGDDTEVAYPYKGVDGSCAYLATAIGSTIKSFVDIKAQDEASLLQAVSTAGPVSIAIQAASDFMFYDSGVYDSTQCSSSPQTLNHGVAAVGYGVDGSAPFWIVRNSWGANWGEAGYIRMARGKNMCGLSDVASYPVV